MISSQSPDSNPFPSSFYPAFAPCYEWFHEHVCEHSTYTSNIHSLLLQTVIPWLLLGPSGADQEEGPREESHTGLGSTLEIRESWVVECNLEVGRTGKWSGYPPFIPSSSNGKEWDAAREGPEQSPLIWGPEVGPSSCTSEISSVLLVNSEKLCEFFKLCGPWFPHLYKGS